MSERKPFTEIAIHDPVDVFVEHGVCGEHAWLTISFADPMLPTVKLTFYGGARKTALGIGRMLAKLARRKVIERHVDATVGPTDVT